jgi:hypothetical protein
MHCVDDDVTPGREAFGEGLTPLEEAFIEAVRRPVAADVGCHRILLLDSL